MWGKGRGSIQGSGLEVGCGRTQEEAGLAGQRGEELREGAGLGDVKPLLLLLPVMKHNFFS